jgi:hypothetical protein
MKTLSALVLAFALTAPSLAHADEPPAPPPPPAAPAPLAAPPPPESPSSLDEPPPRGVGLLVGGGIFTGIGALNLLTAPICKTDLIPDHTTQDACLIASLVIGGTLPMLIVGGSRRSTFKQWQASHPAAAGLGFSPARGGGALTFVGQF